jgi:diketogulonate reductase-like aldo/keto reductase
VLPTSANPERIQGNVWLIDLNDADLEAISRATSRRHRFCDLQYIFGYDVWKESS